nr:dna replication complex gins protein sld5 [Quercus suber]
MATVKAISFDIDLNLPSVIVEGDSELRIYSTILYPLSSIKDRMASEAGEGSTAGMDDYETLISTTDVELLKKAWRNEKAAPEILRFETSLIQRIRGQIQLMEENIEEFAGSGIDPLTVSLYQMDLDRTQYLFRSYLRIRLQKIEKYMFHISKNPEVQSRLSEQEKGFAIRCADDMERHLEESVL